MSSASTLGSQYAGSYRLLSPGIKKDDMSDANKFNEAVPSYLEFLHREMTDIKAAFKELTVAINRLSMVEERQLEDRKAMGRLFDRLDKYDARLAEVERHQPSQARTTAWVDRAIWALAAAAAVFIFSRAGLTR